MKGQIDIVHIIELAFHLGTYVMVLYLVWKVTDKS